MERLNSNLPYWSYTRNLSCKTDCILSCGKGIDGRTRPLQVDTEGAVSVLRNASTYAQAGLYFSVPTSFVVPTDGRIAVFAIVNPVDNNKLMFLDKVTAGLFVREVTGTRIGNEEGLQLTIREQTQLEVAKQTLTPRNNRIGLPQTSTMIVQRVGAVNLSNNSLQFAANYPSGEIHEKFEGQIIVSPGSILLLSIEPLAGNLSNALLSATVTWWEQPLKEKRQIPQKSDGAKNTLEEEEQEKSDH